MTGTTRETFKGWLLVSLGLIVLAAVWTVGLATGWFIVHVAYPLSFWLLCDGLAILVGERSLLARPATLLSMFLLAAGLGLVLDFYMVGLTDILKLTAVTDAGIGVQMYVGWGLCLPAVYQSYRVVHALLRRRFPPRCASALSRWPGPAVASLGFVGLGLAVLPLFFRLWVGNVPGYFVLPAFAGLWLLTEHVQARRQRTSLLCSLLAGDLLPLASMAIASLPFTLLWEGLNALMRSWHYENIFWLEPELAGVPLVVFFGYFCGYYVLFLSVYGAVRVEDEDEVPLYTGARFSAQPPESPSAPGGRPARRHPYAAGAPRSG